MSVHAGEWLRKDCIAIPFLRAETGMKRQSVSAEPMTRIASGGSVLTDNAICCRGSAVCIKWQPAPGAPLSVGRPRWPDALLSAQRRFFDHILNAGGIFLHLPAGITVRVVMIHSLMRHANRKCCAITKAENTTQSPADIVRAPVYQRFQRVRPSAAVTVASIAVASSSARRNAFTVVAPSRVPGFLPGAEYSDSKSVAAI